LNTSVHQAESNNFAQILFYLHTKPTRMAKKTVAVT
jgi:hypothetical protein